MKSKNKGIMLMFIGSLCIFLGLLGYVYLYRSYESKENLHNPNLNDCVKSRVSLQINVGPPITKEEFKMIKQDCKQD